jgi:hypothetical protein
MNQNRRDRRLPRVILCGHGHAVMEAGGGRQGVRRQRLWDSVRLHGTDRCQSACPGCPARLRPDRSERAGPGSGSFGPPAAGESPPAGRHTHRPASHSRPPRDRMDTEVLSAARRFQDGTRGKRGLQSGADPVAETGQSWAPNAARKAHHQPGLNSGCAPAATSAPI